MNLQTIGELRVRAEVIEFRPVTMRDEPQDRIPLPTPDARPGMVLPPGCPGTIPLVIDAEKMFRGHPEIQLIYRGQVYRLRATKQGKLILTK